MWHNLSRVTQYTCQKEIVDKLKLLLREGILNSIKVCIHGDLARTHDSRPTTQPPTPITQSPFFHFVRVQTDLDSDFSLTFRSTSSPIIANFLTCVGLIYYCSQIPLSPWLKLNWSEKINWFKQIKAEVEIEP